MERIFRWGWVIGVLALAGLACTCGALSQASQTTQVLATQAQASTTRVKTIGVPTATSEPAETSEAPSTPTSGEQGTPGTPEFTLGEAPKDIPVYKDNTEFYGASSAVLYSAAISYNDMVKFYKAQMPENGWVEASGSMDAGGFAVLYYEKDNRKATVTVTDVKGHSSVVIAVEQK